MFRWVWAGYQNDPLLPTPAVPLSYLIFDSPTGKSHIDEYAKNSLRCAGKRKKSFPYGTTKKEMKKKKKCTVSMNGFKDYYYICHVKTIVI